MSPNADHLVAALVKSQQRDGTPVYLWEYQFYQRFFREFLERHGNLLRLQVDWSVIADVKLKALTHLDESDLIGTFADSDEIRRGASFPKRVDIELDLLSDLREAIDYYQRIVDEKLDLDEDPDWTRAYIKAELGNANNELVRCVEDGELTLGDLLALDPSWLFAFSPVD